MKSDNLKKQVKSRTWATRRLISLFWPRGKRLMLTGIVAFDDNGDEARISDPDLVQESLRNYWSQVYTRKELDSEKAHNFLAMYFRRHQDTLGIFKEVELPTARTFAKIISRLKDSATGLNGIPYSAYKSVCQLSAGDCGGLCKYGSSFLQPCAPGGS